MTEAKDEFWRRKPGDPRIYKEYQRELSPIEEAAWLLVYNMVEMGVDPEGSRSDKSVTGWWEQEWYGLVRRLKERGLNCDPVWASERYR